LRLLSGLYLIAAGIAAGVMLLGVEAAVCPLLDRAGIAAGVMLLGVEAAVCPLHLPACLHFRSIISSQQETLPRDSSQ
jgi:hypothetical protein